MFHHAHLHSRFQIIVLRMHHFSTLFPSRVINFTIQVQEQKVLDKFEEFQLTENTFRVDKDCSSKITRCSKQKRSKEPNQRAGCNPETYKLVAVSKRHLMARMMEIFVQKMQCLNNTLSMYRLGFSSITTMKCIQSCL